MKKVQEYNKWIVLSAHILERMRALMVESASAWYDIRSTRNQIQIIC